MESSAPPPALPASYPLVTTTTTTATTTAASRRRQSPSRLRGGAGARRCSALLGSVSSPRPRLAGPGAPLAPREPRRAPRARLVEGRHDLLRVVPRARRSEVLLRSAALRSGRGPRVGVAAEEAADVHARGLRELAQVGGDEIQVVYRRSGHRSVHKVDLQVRRGQAQLHRQEPRPPYLAPRTSVHGARHGGLEEPGDPAVA